jgi:hypothetical protein
MRLEIGLVLPLLLAAACSDDGLAAQSSGQIDTSTTGSAVSEGSSNDPGSAGATTGTLEGGTTATPPGGTTSPGDTGADTATIGPESLTGTGTGANDDTGTSTGTGGTETDATTGGPSQACIDGCAVEFMCGTEWASAEDCVTACESNLVTASEFSPFCRDAWEALSACLATLTCEDFAVWQSPMEFPYPCSDADVALSVECKGQ